MAKGMVVSFGRSHGEHTLGEVVRINRKNVKVVQLEPRGSNKSYEVGSLWLVPKEMVAPARVPTARVEAGKKSMEGHPAPSRVVKLKADSGIIPIPVKKEKDARAVLREVSLHSAGIAPTGIVPVPVIAPPPAVALTESSADKPQGQTPKAKTPKVRTTGAKAKTPKAKPVRAKAKEWVPVVAPTQDPTQKPDERGCPVLIDPVTNYRFVGHKGEDLAPFIERIKSVVSR